MAHDVTASRVLDVVLQSPTVPFKEKRRFVMSFIGRYHILVDDRIGSRVGDNCWAFADPYLRVRATSFYLLDPERLLIVSVRMTAGKDCSLVDTTRANVGGLFLREIFRAESEPVSPPAESRTVEDVTDEL